MGTWAVARRISWALNFWECKPPKPPDFLERYGIVQYRERGDITAIYLMDKRRKQRILSLLQLKLVHTLPDLHKSQI